MFLHVPVFMLDGALRSIFGMSSELFRYYRTPTKNPDALMIKCHAYKQLAGHPLCELYYQNKTPDMSLSQVLTEATLLSPLQVKKEKRKNLQYYQIAKPPPFWIKGRPGEKPQTDKTIDIKSSLILDLYFFQFD